MQLIDGRAVAAQIKKEIAEEWHGSRHKAEKHLIWHVLVGHDGGSETYVASKVRACERS